MSDILEEIQELSNKFSNLFEVEGLGNPAVDVPPSQNKIKKDRKTKDGKVEVVSVEDELFPYEGNKREQYRQKILDTINNMIQGTATLEDLLQIVRQKKAPLKEAMELMEDLMSYIIETNLINNRDQYHISKKSVADTEEELKSNPLIHAQSLERMRFGYNNGKDDRKDVAKYRIGMHDGSKSPMHAYKSEYRYDSDSTPAARAKETKRRIMQAHNPEPLEEAMEILEDIHKMIDKHGDKIGPKSELHDLTRSHQREAAIQYAEEKGKPWGERWKDEQDFEDRRKGEDTKNYKGQRKTTEKQFKGFGTVTVGGAEPTELEKKVRREHAKKDGKPVQDYPFDGDLEDYTSDGSKSQKIINKSIARHEKKEQKKAPLEEAMELMEDLFSTILKQPDEKQGSLVYKYHQAKNKENAGKDTYTQAKEEEKRKSKEEKGQEKTEQRKKYRGKSTEDWKQGRLMDQIAKNAAKLAKVSDPATAKAIRRNAQKADLKEAMKVLEELIGEGRNLEDAVVRGYNKGRVSLDDLQKLMDKAHEVPSDSSYFHKSKGEKGELRTKRRHVDYERNVLSDGWGKDDNKKIEASIKRKAKNDKSFPVFQALKAYKEGKANIKEALEIMEAIINEVSVGALARAVENNLPKRKKNEEVAIKAYKQAQDEYEKGSKESPEDEPALYKKLQCTDKAACKEFDKAHDAENLKELNLPKDSKVSANKLFNAAKKVNPERQKKTEETVKNTKGTKEDAKKFLNSLKRDNRSFDISLADPVKSRNEAN